MTIRIPHGIDPNEIIDLDLCQASTRLRVRVEGDVAERLKDAGQQAASAAALARCEEARADLAAYQPGTGPVFRVAHIPMRSRASLTGRQTELQAMPEGVAKSEAWLTWARDVVAAAVRGHSGLKTASGREIPFLAHDGKPSEATLDAYGPFLVDLAWTVLVATSGNVEA